MEFFVVKSSAMHGNLGSNCNIHWITYYSALVLSMELDFSPRKVINFDGERCENFEFRILLYFFYIEPSLILEETHLP